MKEQNFLAKKPMKGGQMKRIIRILVLVTFISVLFVFNTFATTIYDIQYTINPGTNGTYPSPMEGQIVTITGIVTATGFYRYDDNFFISSSDGGIWNGIYIYYAGISTNVGDEVTITGEVQEYNGFTEIGNISNATIISSGNPVPTPILVNTGELIEPSDGEPYEGCLIITSEVTVTDMPDVYGQWYVNDGSGECQIDDGFYNYPDPLKGEIFESIIGAVDYSCDEYGVNPRSLDDIMPHIPDTLNVPGQYCTIQAGIDAAVHGDIVLVQPGTYAEHINLNGKNIIVSSLFYTTQDTSYISQTIIDGQYTGTVVFFNTAEDPAALLCGFTIQHGNGTSSYPWNIGGGILLDTFCSPRLKNLVVKDNYASGYGGGIYCECSDARFHNIEVINNTASHYGGGFYFSYSDPILENITLKDNISNYGGGIHCDHSDPSLENVVISYNHANVWGGGICCEDSNPYLYNIIISNNEAGLCGGGISSDNSNPTLVNSSISNNSTTYYGGGMYCRSNSNPNLENVTISNNLSSEGGGMYCSYSYPIFSIDNRCNIHSNSVTASEGSGADLFNQSDSIIHVIVDTFTVIPPTDYYASPIDKFSFDILHCINDSLINADVYVAVDGDDSNSGTSPYEPFRTIEHAFEMIYADSVNIHTIYLVAGIYSPSTNGENFPINWCSFVHLSGNGEDDTILDAAFSGRAINIINTSDALINNVTIKNGQLSGTSKKGAGIYCKESNLRLENTTITNNSLSGEGSNGGGIYCKFSSLTANNVTISNNSTTGYCNSGWGGGLYCTNSSYIIIENTVIENNVADGNGGGFYIISSPSVSIHNVLVTNNSAKNGAGMYFHGHNPLIENVSIVSNTYSDNYGSGCGIYLGHSNPVIKNVLIADNSCTGNYSRGGGINCYQSNPLLVNVTITNNIITYRGGGFYCTDGASPELINCVLWNDSPQEVYFDNIDAPDSITISYSDIKDGELGIVTNNNGTVSWLDGNIDADPLFVDMINGNYHLSWANYPVTDSTKSPCIDAGDPSSPLDPDGTIADMGAYYFNQNLSVDDPQEITTYHFTNYPNPISSNINNLSVSFYIHKPSNVKIQLFNIKGQLVSTLINEDKNIGEYTISHSVNDLSSGIYFTKLSVDGVDRDIRKVVLLR